MCKALDDQVVPWSCILILHIFCFSAEKNDMSGCFWLLIMTQISLSRHTSFQHLPAMSCIKETKVIKFMKNHVTFLNRLNVYEVLHTLCYGICSIIMEKVYHVHFSGHTCVYIVSFTQVGTVNFSLHWLKNASLCFCLWLQYLWPNDFFFYLKNLFVFLCFVLFFSIERFHVWCCISFLFLCLIGFLSCIPWSDWQLCLMFWSFFSLMKHCCLTYLYWNRWCLASQIALVFELLVMKLAHCHLSYF